MRKVFISLILVIRLFLAPFAMAQGVTFDLNNLRAVIEAKDTVQVNKNIIFDGSKSFLPLDNIEANYTWDFGDGSSLKKGPEVVHSYVKSGEYLVTLTIDQGDETAIISKTVLVYEKLILLLTDITDRKENIQNLFEKALEEGTYIEIVANYGTSTAFLSEEALAKKLADQVDVISNADTIAVWTNRGSGINALTRLVRERPSVKKSLAKKTIVIISDERLNTVGRILQSNFNIIQPKQIVATRDYELRNLVRAKSADRFVKDLSSGVSEYRIINEDSNPVFLWNFISILVNYMVSNGIPSNTIVLLLMLPVIATIISFLKQVIGVTTFGLYTPAIITLSFLALGLKFGLTILVIIIVTGAILRKALAHVRLLHIPRIAIVFTISSLILLMMLALATYLGVSELATVAVFPMLIMTTLAEKFVTAQSGKGVYAAVLLMAETTIVSLICYWIVEWEYLQNLMLSYPEIILLLIVINLFLGRWTGLRVFEYIRFREVMKHAEE